jgi:hypothetical protein
VYTSQWAEFEFKTSVVIGTDCIGSCKSNYHTITATTKRIANCHRGVLCIHYNDFMDFWNLKNNLADHHSLEQTHDGINIYMYISTVLERKCVTFLLMFLEYDKIRIPLKYMSMVVYYYIYIYICYSQCVKPVIWSIVNTQFNIQHS